MRGLCGRENRSYKMKASLEASPCSQINELLCLKKKNAIGFFP